MLKQLEWIVLRCGQLRDGLSASMQAVPKAVRELYHSSASLQTLRGKYRGHWADGLQDRVRIVDEHLQEAGSALNSRDFENAKAQSDAGVQTAWALTADLKSPPAS